MKGKGCLLSWVILILFVSGVYAFNGLFDEDIKSPDFYASNVRMMFKNGQWEEGKRLLDEGLRYYTETNDLNELNGQYYYHHKDYDNARYYLIVAVRDNPENVTAKQLLVKVEEETENYSSAICYVNELLEINPYWQGMWRKKIGLFRLQGNHVEADRLLKRLHQIYPNDSLVQRDYRGSLEERFLRERGGGQPRGCHQFALRADRSRARQCGVLPGVVQPAPAGREHRGSPRRGRTRSVEPTAQLAAGHQEGLHLGR